MLILRLSLFGALCALVCSCTRDVRKSEQSLNSAKANLQQFMVKGVIRELPTGGRSVVIQHEAISNYMEAMTMPFKVRAATELQGLQPGDQVSFRLSVTDEASWIDQIAQTGKHLAAVTHATPGTTDVAIGTSSRHPLLDYQFTNELGRAVSLSQFKGRALAITFFFTRCPIPDYCPRLSKNFSEASRKLAATPEAPTNWHFLSISIDPQFDTPAVLRAYGERYQYDPEHWSFLTGPVDKIREVARLSGMHYEPDSVANHNFRTLIIDPAGQLHTSFPVGGNLSDALAEEMRKACGR